MFQQGSMYHCCPQHFQVSSSAGIHSMIILHTYEIWFEHHFHQSEVTGIMPPVEKENGF